MPRIVDHQQRRRELTRAVWLLMREEGIEAVTIRAVADRSGWSSGAVRHYLPTRDAILTFAAEQIRVDVERHLNARPLTSDAVLDLRSLLLCMLPLTAQGRFMLEVWLAFVGSAVTGQTPGESALVYDLLHEMITRSLDDVQRSGRMSIGHPVALAIELHALLDGLAVHLLLEEITPQAAEAAIDSWLARLISA